MLQTERAAPAALFRLPRHCPKSHKKRSAPAALFSLLRHCPKTQKKGSAPAVLFSLLRHCANCHCTSWMLPAAIVTTAAACALSTLGSALHCMPAAKGYGLGSGACTRAMPPSSTLREGCPAGIGVACKDRLDELTVADWRRLLNLPSGSAMRAVQHHISLQLWLGSRRPLLRLSVGL